MSDLSEYASTLENIEHALVTAKYTMPHAELRQLPAPYFLITGDLALPGLVMTTGTVVVAGSLTITGPVDFQQSGKPIVNLIVTGDCTLGLAYVDAFLCVGGTLHVGTLIADSNWKGAVFVGRDLFGHTLVVHNIGVEVDGETHLEAQADTDDPEAAARAVPGLYIDDEADPRAFFLALRASGERENTMLASAPAKAKAKAKAKATRKSKAKQATGKAKAKPANDTPKAKARPKAKPKAAAKPKSKPKAKPKAKRTRSSKAR